jgi:hypothetical protein
MKNLIFALACITLLVSCSRDKEIEKEIEKETENIVLNGQVEPRTLTATDLVGVWEDSEGLSCVSPDNPDFKKPLYELKNDGTFTFSYQGLHVNSFPTSGKWSIDAEENLVIFCSNSVANSVLKCSWTVLDFSTIDLDLVSTVEALYTVDGTKPEPTYKNLHLYKKN